MADQNPFDQLLTNPTPASAPTGAVSSSNPFDNLFSSPTTSAPQATPVSSNPFDSLFPKSNPETGQTQQPAAPTQHIYQDPSQPFLKRAFDFLDTPLSESVLGIPQERQGAGGIERGLEHIASGLTSPLSLGLMALTFGTGGVIESAGTTALKESEEFAAEELPQIIKGAQAAVKAFGELKPGATAVSDAVREAGVDPALWQRAQDLLFKNGLTEHDLLGGNVTERGVFQILRHTVPSLPIALTARMGKTAYALVSGGLTLTQLETAAA